MELKRLITMLLVFSLAGVSVPPFVRQIHRRFVGVNAAVYLENHNLEYYYPNEVRLIVERLAHEHQQPPKDASIHKETGEVIPHEKGLYIDVDQTVGNVISAPGGAELELVRIQVVPLLRTEHLLPLTAILGSFTTPLMGAPGRVKNIRLSSEAINNTLVLPGVVFSFNEIVGERTLERGYQSAPIILGETVILGVGGGICQTSSTLYNAVVRAGLEIVERRIHSLAPSYIQHGKDATVAWPHTDFKFKNNTDTPIIVKGAIQGGRVRVWIVGAEPKS